MAQNRNIIDLNGKCGLVLGIANSDSIAYGCAAQFIGAGAKLALTYQSEKSKNFVEDAIRPWLQSGDAPIFMPCDLRQDAQLDAVFDEIGKKWGKLDFMLHSIAFAPKADLHARVIDATRQGFLEAMDISCHSFIRVAKHCEKWMKNGGSLLTMTYYGSEKVVDTYNLMGPVKAALESTVRELASELGQSGIRVNALSPGPIATRAAMGLKDFPALQKHALEKSPEHRLASIADVGQYAAFLVSDAAKAVTGTVAYVDAGYSIMD